jgi:phosphoribosyl 1,2-cyclic phosphodiesterase
MKLTFLGTRGEIEARTRHHRRHSALLVSWERRRVLIDCGADWLGRIESIGPHAILLTHAHPDHAFGLADGAPCPVWAPAQCWDTLPRFPIAQQRTIALGRPRRIESIIVQAFTVEHSLRAPAVGYRIRAGGVSIFYAPDLVFIHERGRALAGIRAYIGDGASLTRPLVRKRGDRLIGHASVSAQLGWCAREHVPRVFITHCGSQIVTASHSQMRAAVERLGRARGLQAELAVDGRSVLLRAARSRVRRRAASG